MKSYYSFVAVLFLFLFTNSISWADDWIRQSDLPFGTNQCKIAAGEENGNSAQFLVAGDGAGLFKSTDGGLNWENIGLVDVGITSFLDDISNSGEYIVTADDGVYKTTNGGTSWHHYTSGIEGLFITDISKIHPYKLQGLVVGTVGNGVFFSADGETWTPYGIGLENKTVTSVEVKLGTGTTTLRATTQDEGVWEYDFGTTIWSPINSGIPSKLNNTAIASNDQGELFLTNFDFGVCSSPNDPVFWTIENPNFLFGNGIICTQDGEVYASSFGNGANRRDLFGNWTGYSSGLLEINGYIDVVSLAMDYLGFLWVVVIPFEPGGVPGIYRTVNPVTDIEDNSIVTPEDFRLMQNYPNPFNPSTTINYSVPNISFVTIRIYDVLGNQIAELVNEEKSIGVHEVTFNASNLSTGTYFYQLQAVSTSSGSGNSFVETRKMILIK